MQQVQSKVGALATELRYGSDTATKDAALNRCQADRWKVNAFSATENRAAVALMQRDLDFLEAAKAFAEVGVVRCLHY